MWFIQTYKLEFLDIIFSGNKYFRQPSNDFDVCNFPYCDVVYTERL